MKLKNQTSSYQLELLLWQAYAHAHATAYKFTYNEILGTHLPPELPIKFTWEIK